MAGMIAVIAMTAVIAMAAMIAVRAASMARVASTTLRGIVGVMRTMPSGRVASMGLMGTMRAMLCKSVIREQKRHNQHHRPDC